MTLPRILMSALLLGNALPTFGASAASCDQEWQKLSEQYVTKAPADYAGMLSAWKALGKSCEGQTYRARLGLIYFYLDRPQDAQTAIAELSPDSREPVVQLVQILIDAAFLREKRTPSETELKSMEQRLIRFSDAHPTDVVGMSLLADIVGELGRHEIAISLYERALSSLQPTPAAAGVMRNLTISYSEVGRHQEAFDMAGQAVAFNKGYMEDLYFMCALATSQTALGHIDGAQDTLTLLAVKKPGVKTSPLFLDTVELVKAKMRPAQ